MLEPSDEFLTHVRHIKWILSGILACLLFVVIAMIPILIPLLLVVLIGLILGGLLYACWDTFRDFVIALRTRSLTLWHRWIGI